LKELFGVYHSFGVGYLSIFNLFIKALAVCICYRLSVESDDCRIYIILCMQ